MALTRRTFITGSSAAIVLGLSTTLIGSAAMAAEKRPLISRYYNQFHPEVKALQKHLIRAGYDVGHWGADGHYGPATELAASHFQTANLLWRDGVVGPITWGALLSAPNDDGKPDIHPTSIAVARAEGAAIDISKKDRKVRLLTLRSDGSVRTHITLEARFGGPNYPLKDGKHQTNKPLVDYQSTNGQFRVTRKVRDEVSTYVADAEMPFSIYYYRGEAIHFSKSFKDEGYNGSSHGCVNVRDRKQAEHLFKDTREGYFVLVH